MTTQNFDEQDFRQELEPVTEARYLSSPQGQDPFHAARWHAKRDGQKQARSDFELYAISPEPEIYRKAQLSWDNVSDKSDILEIGRVRQYDEVQNVYIQTYFDTYNEEVEKKGKELPDAKMYQIGQLVQLDRNNDDIIIPLDYLPYQAAFRVKHLCTNSPTDTLAYFEEIHKYVNIYIQEYQRYKVVLESEDRSSDRSGFRRQWQQY